MESEIFLSVYNNYATVQLYKPRLLQYYYLKYDYPNIRKPSGRQRFSSFSMLKAKIFLIENSFAMLKAKIFLIETSLSMSKGFLDHNLFHDPNVTTIHRDFPDNRAKDVRISILCPALLEWVWARVEWP